MRFVYLFLLIVLLAAFLAFAVVNRAGVDVDFPFTDTQISAPLFLVLAAVYLLGMLTGGFVIGFVRHSIHRASRHPEH
jgi:uncharacterized integral membrane protein